MQNGSCVEDQENEKTSKQSSLVQPYQNRLWNVAIVNAILADEKEQEQEHQRAIEEQKGDRKPQVFRRFVSPALRLEGPPTSLSPSDKDDDADGSCWIHGTALKRHQKQTAKDTLYHEERQRHRGRSTRSKRQRKPPPFLHCWDMYKHQSLGKTDTAIKVSVLHHLLGSVRLTFWAWRNNTITRRPAVHMIKSKCLAKVLKEQFKWWKARFTRDREVSLRLQWHDRRQKQITFDELFRHSSRRKGCRVLVKRYQKLCYGCAFYRWQRIAGERRRSGEEGARRWEAGQMVCKRRVFGALVLHSQRRRRVKERAVKHLSRIRSLQRRLLVRWRAYTTRTLAIAREIDAANMPLKREAFQVIKKKHFHYTPLIPPDPTIAIKHKYAPGTLGHLLTRPGRLPLFETYSKTFRALSSIIHTKVALLKQAFAINVVGAVKQRKRSSLPITKSSSTESRRGSGTGLWLSRTSRVFHDGTVEVYTQPNKLHKLQAASEIVTRWNRHLSLAGAGRLPVYLTRKEVGTKREGRDCKHAKDSDDDNDDEEEGIATTNLVGSAPPKTLSDLIFTLKSYHQQQQPPKDEDNQPPV